MTEYPLVTVIWSVNDDRDVRISDKGRVVSVEFVNQGQSDAIVANQLTLEQGARQKIESRYPFWDNTVYPIRFADSGSKKLVIIAQVIQVA